MLETWYDVTYSDRYQSYTTITINVRAESCLSAIENANICLKALLGGKCKPTDFELRSAKVKK